MQDKHFDGLSVLQILGKVSVLYSDKIALEIFQKDGRMRMMTYCELADRTRDISAALMKNGIEKGDRVCIFSESRPEWGVAFFGIISAEAVVVPLDVQLEEKEIGFILAHSEARAVLVSAKYMEKIKNVIAGFDKNIFLISLEYEKTDENVLSIGELRWRKSELYHRNVDRKDLILIVYTSGTTGDPKGVKLTYNNILHQIEAISEAVDFSEKDRFLSILPLNHMFEITCGFITPLSKGARITYMSKEVKISSISDVMQKTQPTIILAVPKFIKFLYHSILSKLNASSICARKLFNMSLCISSELSKLGINPGKILFKKVHNEFGGKLRGLVSGGAPLDKEIVHKLNLMNITVLEGYGLTETSPVVTVNTFKHNRVGSVGKPLLDTEIKIVLQNHEEKTGEILIKGPQVMNGYYKNPQATKKAFSDDWFHTGDIGYTDKDGYLYITGRLKNIIVTDGGKKIHPEEVEEVISKSPYIQEACVLGKKIVSGIKAGTEEVFAIVVPNLERIKEEGLALKEDMQSFIRKELHKHSKLLAPYKKITSFMISEKELPKTSTLKIKRKEVEKIVSGNDKI